MSSPITVTVLNRMKVNGEKITAVTACDYPFAALVDGAGIRPSASVRDRIVTARYWCFTT